jgi:hypothetical protein
VVHRMGLFVASLAAVVVLVVGLSVAGQPVARGPVASQTAEQAVAADPTPRIQVDTVYVAPQKQPAPIVVRRSIPATGGEKGAEGESEGGDD